MKTAASKIVGWCLIIGISISFFVLREIKLSKLEKQISQMQYCEPTQVIPWTPEKGA